MTGVQTCALPIFPSTAAHELAHTRGFAREDECNFFAFLTSIASDSADCRYSGYLSDVYKRQAWA